MREGQGHAGHALPLQATRGKPSRAETVSRHRSGARGDVARGSTPEFARYVLSRETQANMLQKTQTNASLTHFNKTEPALMTRVKGLQFWFKLVTTDYFLSHYDLSNLQPNSRYHLRSALARFPSSRLRDASTGDRLRSARPGPGPCGLVSCRPRGTGVRGPRASRKLSSASVTSRLTFSVHYVNFRQVRERRSGQILLIRMPDFTIYT